MATTSCSCCCGPATSGTRPPTGTTCASGACVPRARCSTGADVVPDAGCPPDPSTPVRPCGTSTAAAATSAVPAPTARVASSERRRPRAARPRSRSASTATGAETSGAAADSSRRTSASGPAWCRPRSSRLMPAPRGGGEGGAQPGQAAGVLRLHRAGGAAEVVGGLLHRQVEPVPQHHHGALAGREGGQRRADGGTVRPVGRSVVDLAQQVGPQVGAVRQHLVRLLAVPPGAAGLVDVGVHQDPPDVGLLVAAAAHRRPGQVEPGERGLHEVLGQVHVAGRQQRGGAHQGGAARDDERAELALACGVPSAGPDRHGTSVDGAGARWGCHGRRGTVAA